MKRFYSLVFIIVLTLILSACGGDSSDSSSLDSMGRLSTSKYIESCNENPQTFEEAIQNIVIISNVENELYADLLLIFSEHGKYELFDTDVDIGENDEELLEKNYNTVFLRSSELYLGLKSCYENSVYFIENDSNKAISKNKKVIKRGLLYSIGNFFGFMGGTIENTRSDMVAIGTKNSSTKQEMYEKAKYLWPNENFGSDSDVFYSNLQSGSYSDKINQLHNSLYHDVDTNYYYEAEDLKKAPVNKVLKEGKTGLEKGVDLYVESTKVITGGLPNGEQFSKGYDYAKDTIEIINKAEKDGVTGGIWEYISKSSTKYLGNKYKEFLESKAHLGDLINDGIKDVTENYIKSMSKYLNNLLNYNKTDNELKDTISKLESSGDTNNTGNKVIKLDPNETIDKPNLGIVVSKDYYGNQNTHIVVYPSEKNILLNIDDDFTYLDLLFSNENDDNMNTTLVLSDNTIQNVDEFSEVNIYVPMEITFSEPIVKEYKDDYTMYDVKISYENITQETYIKYEYSGTRRGSSGIVAGDNVAFYSVYPDGGHVNWIVGVGEEDVTITVSLSLDGKLYDTSESYTIKGTDVSDESSDPDNSSGGTYSGTYTGYGEGCPTTGTISFSFNNNSVNITSSNINGGGTVSLGTTSTINLFNGQDSKGTYWAGAISDAGKVEGTFSTGSCGGEYHVSN